MPGRIKDRKVILLKEGGCTGRDFGWLSYFFHNISLSKKEVSNRKQRGDSNKTTLRAKCWDFRSHVLCEGSGQMAPALKKDDFIFYFDREKAKRNSGSTEKSG
jgi:hypothetical protein